MVYFKYFFLPLISVAKNRHQPGRQCWLLGDPVPGSVAKGKFERQEGLSWFPVSPSLLPQAGSGCLFRPLGTLLMPCASVDLTAHLSIEPLEQEPAFTQLFLWSPWQSHCGVMLKTRGGGRKEQRTKAGHMRLKCVSNPLVSCQKLSVSQHPLYARVLRKSYLTLS